mmetsp:Transcript_26198/g.39667  ORF Transcript_26198/g.39667 Transcript_26198/m.39667 type:complete len:370 (-) Transcript_26198:57-1166(-)
MLKLLLCCLLAFGGHADQMVPSRSTSPVRRYMGRKTNEMGGFNEGGFGSGLSRRNYGGSSGGAIQPFYLIVLCLLAANSGFLNGLTLSGVLDGRKEGVVSVSGAYTTSALAYFDRNDRLFNKQLRLVASYAGGSLLNGLMNPWGINWYRTQLSLLFSGVLVLLGAFYYFTTNEWDWLLSFVAMATGLQNSWMSMVIKEFIIGSSYYSGSTSDLATFLGQVLRERFDGGWKFSMIWSLSAIAASFWIGAYFSISAGTQFGEVSFLLSVAVYLLLYGIVQDRIWRGDGFYSRRRFDFGGSRRQRREYRQDVDISDPQIMWSVSPPPDTRGSSTPLRNLDSMSPQRRRRSRRKSQNSISNFLSSVASNRRYY